MWGHALWTGLRSNAPWCCSHYLNELSNYSKYSRAIWLYLYELIKLKMEFRCGGGRGGGIAFICFGIANQLHLTVCLCTNRKQKWNLNTASWQQQDPGTVAARCAHAGGQNSHRESPDWRHASDDLMALRMKTYRKTDGGPQTRRVRDRSRARKMELDFLSYILNQKWT